jgi:hypothetical protein
LSIQTGVARARLLLSFLGLRSATGTLLETLTGSARAVTSVGDGRAWGRTPPRSGLVFERRRQQGKPTPPDRASPGDLRNIPNCHVEATTGLWIRERLEDRFLPAGHIPSR